MKELSILAITLVVSFTVWIVVSIFNLQASFSDVQEIKQDVKEIRTFLMGNR
jgi:hypothetical protein